MEMPLAVTLVVAAKHPYQVKNNTEPADFLSELSTYRAPGANCPLPREQLGTIGLLAALLVGGLG